MIAVRWWLPVVALMLAWPACMIEMAAKTDRTLDPKLRDSPEVRVALYADDRTTESLVRAALARTSYVIVESVDADGRARYRASCGGLGSCDAGLLDTWARDHGERFVVIAQEKIARAGFRVCASFRFTADGGICDDEYVEEETATVEVRVEMDDLTADRPGHAFRRVLRPIRAHGEGQGPRAVEDARAVALDALPVERLEAAFTPQLSVASDGRLTAEPVSDHSIFGVFRDGKRRMLVDVAGAGTPAEVVTPLYCCVQTQPEDTLVYRGPQLLLELMPTVAITRLSVDGDGRAAGLFGVSLRARNLRRGLRGGVSYEYAVARGVRVSLGTFELGYGFRPSPAWALGLLGGVGGGEATQLGRAPGDVSATGGHVEALLRATWEPRRWVFLNLDVGAIQSFGYHAWKNDAGSAVGAPLKLAGPIVRLSAEIE